MTPETKENLDYLRKLHAKYNGYWGKYFGFTMTQMAQYLGMPKPSFSEIIKGKYNIADKHELAFNKMFKEFKIIEKTKDFKESNWQLGMREMWAKQKNT